MKNYQFEKELDDLLRQYCEVGTGAAVQTQTLTGYTDDKSFESKIDILKSRGLIKAAKLPGYMGGGYDRDFNVLTPEGVDFNYSTSFVEEAKKQDKANSKFAWESFKVKSETIIIFLSLLLSIIALLVAVFKDSGVKS